MRFVKTRLLVQRPAGSKSEFTNLALLDYKWAALAWQNEGYPLYSFPESNKNDMKKVMWCLVLCGFLACTDDPPEGEGQGSASEAAQDAVPANPDELPAEATNGSFQPPVAPEPSNLVQILTNDFWVWEYYVVDDRATRLANKGRWFKLSADGTFESGRWQQKTGYGSWRLLNQDGKQVLAFDNVDDRQDEQWEIQGINQSQDTMTWAGVPDTKTEGAILKAISLLTRPTRKQFGVAE